MIQYPLHLFCPIPVEKFVSQFAVNVIWGDGPTGNRVQTHQQLDTIRSVRGNAFANQQHAANLLCNLVVVHALDH